MKRRAMIMAAMVTVTMGAWVAVAGAQSAAGGRSGGVAGARGNVTPARGAVKKPSYKVTRLNPINNKISQSSSPMGINDDGVVVGRGTVDDEGRQGPLHAVMWAPSKPATDLGTLAGPTRISQATAINNKNQIVGRTQITHGDEAPFGAFFKDGNGKMEVLGEEWADVVAINDAGQVVGNLAGKAMLWEKGKPGQDIGTIGGLGNTYAEALAINNLGQVVGDGAVASGHGLLPFIWDARNGIKKIDIFPDCESGRPLAINNKGVVVGTCTLANRVDGSRGFIWDSEKGMRGLAPLKPDTLNTIAYGINDEGQIVGQSGGRAVVYIEGVLFDLNDVAKGAKGAITEARKINNKGQIIAVDMMGGILLTPDGPAAPRGAR